MTHLTVHPYTAIGIFIILVLMVIVFVVIMKWEEKKMKAKCDHYPKAVKQKGFPREVEEKLKMQK